MNEIICPNCNKAFKVDEAGFADIVKQVRDHQFEEELANRLDLAEKEKESAVKLAVADLRGSLQKELVEKDKLLTEKLAAKELELSEMESRIQNAETVKKLEVSEAIEKIEKERDALRHDLKTKEAEKESAIKLAEANIKSSLEKELTEKDRRLSELKTQSDIELAEKLAAKELALSEMKSKINHTEIEKRLEISEATKVIEKERDKLMHELQIKETEKELLEKSIQEKFRTQLVVKDETIKMKDDEIDRLRNFKQKLSTKMVGETLEQHCEVEFNKLRATGFQNAYFEKDNDSRGGTKGDYIYKETDEEGNEIISIMFEMKNENDETRSLSDSPH